MREISLKQRALGVAALLMVGVSSASAVGLSNVTTNGFNIAYFTLNPANCTLTKSTTDPGATARTAIVQGSNTPCIPSNNPGPGGNIELGDFDNQVWTNVSTLTGTLQGFGTITLSSLQLSDWQTEVAPGVTLAQQYILAAIAANCGGSPPTSPVLAAAVSCFLTGTAADCGTPIDPPPAQRASDPNIFYANAEANGQVRIGLAGALNAAELNPGFLCPNQSPPIPLQLSEVVKFNASWATDEKYKDQYLYSFNPSPSGTTTTDSTESYDAIYEVRPKLPMIGPPPTPVPAITPMGISLLSGLLALVGAWRVRGFRRR